MRMVLSVVDLTGMLQRALLLRLLLSHAVTLALERYVLLFNCSYTYIICSVNFANVQIVSKSGIPALQRIYGIDCFTHSI
jgi:hypothetical protein